MVMELIFHNVKSSQFQRSAMAALISGVLPQADVKVHSLVDRHDGGDNRGAVGLPSRRYGR